MDQLNNAAFITGDLENIWTIFTGLILRKC